MTRKRYKQNILKWGVMKDVRSACIVVADTGKSNFEAMPALLSFLGLGGTARQDGSMVFDSGHGPRRSEI